MRVASASLYLTTKLGQANVTILTNVTLMYVRSPRYVNCE